MIYNYKLFEQLQHLITQLGLCQFLIYEAALLVIYGWLAEISVYFFKNDDRPQFFLCFEQNQVLISMLSNIINQFREIFTKISYQRVYDILQILTNEQISIQLQRVCCNQ
eukprot:TRINITY_DN20458_c0_g1_i1.p2 TRINITY_DN20458_c0_g1~~TRINITY_DN20458_c0_g1_i1.p2  ORF type:complete len:110 (+),score=2.84 TRINITY_DN20458_c0_g1_i1:255-584(+)